jgi:RNA recognition motif. (a.k.a. RRM, RBD, or RNP domain)
MASSRNSIKLFVGGLPPTLTCAELAEVFAPHSKKMTIDLKMDANHHLNRGFAFLYLNDHSLVEEITSKNYRVKNRLIQVQVSRATSKSFRPEGCRVFCRGIPSGTSDFELTEFFQSFADCRCAYAIREGSGENKGFGFIELNQESDAQMLLSTKTIQFKNAYLMLEPFLKPKSKNSVKESSNHHQKSLPSNSHGSKKKAQAADLQSWGEFGFGTEPHYEMNQEPVLPANVKTQHYDLQTSPNEAYPTMEIPFAAENYSALQRESSVSDNVIHQENYSVFNQEGLSEGPKIQLSQAQATFYDSLPAVSEQPATRNMVYQEDMNYGAKALISLGHFLKHQDGKAFLFTRASTSIPQDLFAGTACRLNHTEGNLKFRHGCPPPAAIGRYITMDH